MSKIISIVKSKDDDVDNVRGVLQRAIEDTKDSTHLMSQCESILIIGLHRDRVTDKYLMQFYQGNLSDMDALQLTDVAHHDFMHYCRNNGDA